VLNLVSEAVELELAVALALAVWKMVKSVSRATERVVKKGNEN
jgi:hypothetical protein